MLCLLSFLVFGFLGIFFAEYREMAREAFGCMVQRAKTGSCDADFEDRMRSTIIGKAMDRSPRLASFLNSYLDYITWVLAGILILSAAYAGVSIFNYLAYGNCNGPASNAGCSIAKAANLNVTAEIRESIRFWLPG